MGGPKRCETGWRIRARSIALDVTCRLPGLADVTEPVRYVNPAGVRPPRGEYSHVAVLPIAGTRLCFVSGQVGYAVDGRADPDLNSQMERTFENLGHVLESVGSSLGSVLQLTTYLTREADIAPYMATRAELFPRLFPRASRRTRWSSYRHWRGPSC
jgi:enamine deaminase RidA (YjgF/YER057c/UK114 family)